MRNTGNICSRKRCLGRGEKNNEKKTLLEIQLVHRQQNSIQLHNCSDILVAAGMQCNGLQGCISDTMYNSSR